MVCPYDIGEPGGVREQVLGLSAELTARGHTVTVIAPGTAPGVVGVGRSVPVRVNGSVARIAPQPTAAWRTVRTIRRGGFDVVHLHEPFAPSITLPALLSAGAPVVATFHAAGECSAYRLFRRPLSAIASRIDHRVAVSSSAAAFAIENIGGEYEVLFNAVDSAPFRHDGITRLPNPTVFFIGRHEPRKGLGVLIDAIHRMDTATELFIAGDGPDTERLRRRHPADERIHWLGRLSDARKIHWMRMSTVVCVPSLGGESFGIVPLEAMAAHTPVVMSDIAAYRQISEDGRAAVLVPPGDAEALAEALDRMVTDGAATESMCEIADDVVDRFSFVRLADRYESIYRSLIGDESLRSELVLQ